MIEQTQEPMHQDRKSIVEFNSNLDSVQASNNITLKWVIWQYARQKGIVDGPHTLESKVVSLRTSSYTKCTDTSAHFTRYWELNHWESNKYSLSAAGPWSAITMKRYQIQCFLQQFYVRYTLQSYWFIKFAHSLQRLNLALL